MKQSLSITKYVLKLLKANTALMDLVPYARIYPIDAKQGTTFPFIVINRDSVLSAYSKDGCFEDTVTVTATAVTDRYDMSVSIASEIRNSLLHIIFNALGSYLMVIGMYLLLLIL